MFYDIYTAVKTQLNNEIGTLEGVEWYNVQYEGSIPTTPRIFIEFPEALPFEQTDKQTRRTPLKMRLHVVTQAIADNDGTIPDAVALEHETTALAAMNAIDKFIPLKTAAKLTSPLQFSRWQHYHKHKGWMVTFVEFDAKKLL